MASIRDFLIHEYCAEVNMHKNCFLGLKKIMTFPKQAPISVFDGTSTRVGDFSLNTATTFYFLLESTGVVDKKVKHDRKNVETCAKREKNSLITTNRFEFPQKMNPPSFIFGWDFKPFDVDYVGAMHIWTEK